MYKIYCREPGGVVVSTVTSHLDGSWFDSHIEPLCGFRMLQFKNMHAQLILRSFKECYPGYKSKRVLILVFFFSVITL